MYVYQFFSEGDETLTVMSEETMYDSLVDLSEGAEVSDAIYRLVIEDAVDMSASTQGIDN